MADRSRCLDGGMCAHGAECPAAVESVTRNNVTHHFITMGHPGFNSPANNGLGYRSEWTARQSSRRYQAKGDAARAVQTTAAAVQARHPDWTPEHVARFVALYYAPGRLAQ